MATETELKLRISPEHMARLKRHPFLRTLSIKPAISRKLYSVYFDTPSLKLHHARMALRLRRVGKQWLQTLKGGGGVQAGLHLRNEWETPVAGEKLDFEALEAIGASPLKPSLRKKLQSVFVTDFTRSIRMVEFEGALIEMALDSGEVRAGESVHPISELELELKSGDALQLFRLALAIFELVPFEIESTSKAEYGYMLHTPVPANVTKASIPQFNSDDSVGSALQAMIWACLSHLQINVSGALKHTYNEYLHQIRIALRKLRVVLSMVAKQSSDAELSSLRKLVAELASSLGRSREWDVFTMETLVEVQKPLRKRPEWKSITLQCEILRQQQHQLVLAALQSGDFQRMLLRFGAWMHGDFWRNFSNEDELLLFAAEVLHGHSRKVRRYRTLLQYPMDVEQLHSLRIACKNLRYSAELFASMHEAKKMKAYVDALTKLQDVLGALNDHAVAHRLLLELADSSSQKTISLINIAIEHRYSNFLIELKKVWKKFSKQTDVWA
ncbi:MAG: CHAD domain-containing protein [Gallionellaceae bacterium]